MRYLSLRSLFLYVALCALFVGFASRADAENFKFESKSPFAPSFATTIGGELSFPSGSGPFPVVILLHACGGLDRWGNSALSAHAQSLNKAGFATYILDSFTARKLTADQVCPKPDESFNFRVDDLFNAQEALQKHPKIDRNKFFAVGMSHGASVALSAAIKSTDYRGFRAVAAFYPSCKLVQNERRLKSSVIIFVGAKDDWTPASECEGAKRRERPPGGELELVVFPNAYHGFDQPRSTYKYLGHTLGYNEQATESSRKIMQDFFARHLNDEPAAAGRDTSPKSEKD
jgi:dienelactone hydrolase